MIPLGSHSGDRGDLIYALAALRSTGPWSLRLFPSGLTTHAMTLGHAEPLLPLLRCQPYLAEAHWSERPEGRNLDGWRYLPTLPGENLADWFARWLAVPISAPGLPWLHVDRVEQVAEVVIHRSPRYRAWTSVGWRRVWDKVGSSAVFVGLPDEHADFCREVGADVPYRRTADFLELARVIAGCDLFIGNQSAPRAIAEGLKVPVLQETCSSVDNCRFERPRTHYATCDAEINRP